MCDVGLKELEESMEKENGGVKEPDRARKPVGCLGTPGKDESWHTWLEA